MQLMYIRGSAAHALFHTMQRVDMLLRELELMDLHRISVCVVNECFTHRQGLKSECQVDEVEQAIREILAAIPERVKDLSPLVPWQDEYRKGLAMELVGKLHQALGLVGAYRNLPETLPVRPYALHTAEGVIGHETDENWLEHAFDWKPGAGPWG